MPYSVIAVTLRYFIRYRTKPKHWREKLSLRVHRKNYYSALLEITFVSYSHHCNLIGIVNTSYSYVSYSYRIDNFRTVYPPPRCDGFPPPSRRGGSLPSSHALLWVSLSVFYRGCARGVVSERGGGGFSGLILCSWSQRTLRAVDRMKKMRGIVPTLNWKC